MMHPRESDLRHGVRNRRLLSVVLIAYLFGFVVFAPRTLLVVDEALYVSQAMAFAHGGATLPSSATLYPPAALTVPSNYPPLTSLLQTPFVATLGWRGAAVLSLLSLIAATLLTARLLRNNGCDERFALLIPGYLPTLFFARTAMSDVPAGVWVALTLWLLWRSADRSRAWSFAAGLAAGLTLLLREPLVVLLAPIFLGAILRRKTDTLTVIVGGIVGMATRLAVFQLLFGNALYVRDSGYGFSLVSAVRNFPETAIAMLVLVPAGALLPFFYKGERRAEIGTAVTVYSALFLFYEYDPTRENGAAKGLLLFSRYFIPALPLLALCASEVYPRWYSAARVHFKIRAPVGTRLSAENRSRVSVLGSRLVPAAIALAAFGIHPVVRRLEAAPASVLNALLSNTSEDRPVITNHLATTKYLSPVYAPRRLILRSFITGEDVPRFVRQYGPLSIAFLDRQDSELFREDAAANAPFLSEVRRLCDVQPKYDRDHPGIGRVYVAEVTSCR